MRKSAQINGWFISVCGLNCALYDIREAGLGDSKLWDEIVEWFRKERGEEVDPEQVRCEGCRGSPESHARAPVGNC